MNGEDAPRPGKNYSISLTVVLIERVAGREYIRITRSFLTDDPDALLFERRASSVVQKTVDAYLKTHPDFLPEFPEAGVVTARDFSKEMERSIDKRQGMMALNGKEPLRLLSEDLLGRNETVRVTVYGKIVRNKDTLGED